MAFNFKRNKETDIQAQQQKHMQAEAKLDDLLKEASLPGNALERMNKLDEIQDMIFSMAEANTEEAKAEVRRVDAAGTRDVYIGTIIAIVGSIPTHGVSTGAIAAGLLSSEVKKEKLNQYLSESNRHYDKLMQYAEFADTLGAEIEKTAPEAALAEKLKSAFAYAVFLGYGKSRAVLGEALDQVAPLTYVDKKAAFFALTEEQLRADLDRKADELEKTGKKVNAAIKGVRLHPRLYKKYESARYAFNGKSIDLEERVLEARKSFAADIAEAQKLAQEAGRPEIATIVAVAQKLCPVPAPGPHDTIATADIKRLIYPKNN